MSPANPFAEEESRGRETPAFLTIGIVLGPWGARGEIRVEAITDFPERFHALKVVLVQGSPWAVEGVRWHRGQVLMKLSGLENREDAAQLRGQELEVSLAESVPLPEGRHYLYQIVGLEAWTTDGRLLGRVAEVLRTPGNDVYVVRGGGREFLIPAIDQVVKKIEPGEGRIIIEPLRGLLD